MKNSFLPGDFEGATPSRITKNNSQGTIFVIISCQRVSRFQTKVRKSACAPLCCKNLCCGSRFCTGGRGAAGSRSKQLPKGPQSKMLAQGSNLRLRDEGGSRGRSSAQDQKTRTVRTCRIDPGGLSRLEKYFKARIFRNGRVSKTLGKNPVNLFLSKLVRISGFSFLFFSLSDHSLFSTLWQNVLKRARSLRKERKTQKSSLI